MTNFSDVRSKLQFLRSTFKDFKSKFDVLSVNMIRVIFGQHFGVLRSKCVLNFQFLDEKRSNFGFKVKIYHNFNFLRSTFKDFKSKFDVVDLIMIRVIFFNVLGF